MRPETPEKFAEKRYALHYELWALRQQKNRINEELNDLQQRLSKNDPSKTGTRLSKKMYRVRKERETELQDKSGFLNLLRQQERDKRNELVEVEKSLRIFYHDLAISQSDSKPAIESFSDNNNQLLSARNDEFEYDIFISHATEDKTEIVRPLVRRLKELGLLVWYDETELSIGDSLRQCIDRGLSKSSYGLVVLSNHFLNKKWPQYELDSLVALEIERGKVILPIWHGITKQQLLSSSPKLADKVALNTANADLDDIALDIAMAVIKKR